LRWTARTGTSGTSTTRRKQPESTKGCCYFCVRTKKKHSLLVVLFLLARFFASSEGGGTADIGSPDTDPDTDPDGTADGNAIQARWDYRYRSDGIADEITGVLRRGLGHVALKCHCNCN
jgi:hypothetical protein